MKSKNISKIFFALSGLMLLGGGAIFCACSPNGENEYFSEEQIIVSIGQKIDLNSKFNSKISAEFVASGKGVMIEGSQLIGNTPGSYLVYATSGSKKLDSIEVVVTDYFAEPDEFAISADGLLSWRELVGFFKDEEIEASYEIKFYDGDVAGQAIFCEDNTYQLQSQGVYYVSVRALAAGENENKIKSSDFSAKTEIVYESMPAPTDLVFSSAGRDNESKGTLSFSYNSDAKFRAYVDGMVFESDTTEIEIDFSSLARTEVTAYVEAIDKEGKKASAKSETITIKKLATPNVTYSGDNAQNLTESFEGELVWTAVQGARGYYVTFSRVGGGDSGEYFTEDNSTLLDGAVGGEYYVTVRAVSNTPNVANSSAGVVPRVYKLHKPEVEASLVDSSASVDVNLIAEEDYVERILFAHNNVSSSRQLLSGNFKTTESVDEKGRHEFKAKALPKTNNRSVEAINGLNIVIGSEFGSDGVYNLNEISEANITHSLKNNESVLTFTLPDYCQEFSLQINEQDYPLDEEKIERNGQNVVVNLGQIDRDAFSLNDGDSFTFKIISKRTDGKTISSTSTKHMTILDAVDGNKKSGESIEGESYEWQAKEGAKYRYEIYKTGSDFSFGAQPDIMEITNSNQTQNLREGFYVIRVYTLALNDNTHLGSKEYYEDSFIVTKDLQKVQITDFYLDEDPVSATYNRYVLKFDVKDDVSFARSYQILVGENAVETKDAKAGETTFIFGSSYNFDESAVITINISAKDADNQKVYQANSSTLNVIRQKAPTLDDIEVDKNQTLSFKYTDEEENKFVEIVKDGTIIDKENLLRSVSLLDVGGVCRVKITRTKHNELSDGYNSTAYLSSKAFELEFVRDSSPKDLSYNDGVTTFMYEGIKQSFSLELSLYTLNSAQPITVEIQISEKSFNLSEVVHRLCGQDFIYQFDENKTKLELKLWSDVSEFIDGKYYLPSKYNNGQEEGYVSLVIDKLKRVFAEFNRNDQTISWQSDNESGTIYDVYIGSQIVGSVELVKEDSLYSFSLAEKISGFNEAEAYYVKIISHRPNYFDSDESNQIGLFVLPSLKSTRINSDNTLEFELTSQMKEPYSRAIYLNDSEQALSQNTISLSGEEETFTVKILASLDAIGGVYYLDSREASFKIKKEELTSFNANIQTSDGKILWQDVTTNLALSGAFDFDGKSVSFESLVSYVISVSQNGQIKKTQKFKSSEFSLDDDFFKDEGLTSGNVEVSVYVYTDDYRLLAGGEGIYIPNNKQIASKQINKLNKVSNITIAFSSNTESKTLEEELNRTVKVSWTKGDEKSGVKYRLEIKNGDQVIYLSEEIAETSTLIPLEKMLGRVIVWAVYPTDLSSTKLEKEIVRQRTPTLEILDDGKLEIVGDSNKYIVHLDIDDGSEVKKSVDEVITGQELDLMKYLNVDGDNLKVSVKVISVGGEVLSSEVAELEKNLLSKGKVFVLDGTIYFFVKDGSSAKIQTENQTFEYDRKLNVTKKAIDGGDMFSLNNEGEKWTLFTFNLANEKFTIFAQKDGYISSYHELSNGFETEELSDITDIKAKASGSQKHTLFVENQDAKSLAIKVKNDDELAWIFTNKNEFDADLISWLDEGDYKVVMSMSEFSDNLFKYSNAFEFSYVVDKNVISDAEINVAGFLTWKSETPAYYIVKSVGGREEETAYNYYDLFSLSGQLSKDLTVSVIANGSFNKEGNSVKTLSKVYSPSNEISLSIAQPSYAANITIIKEDNSARLKITPNELNLNQKIYVEYQGKVVNVNALSEGGSYYVTYIDIFEAIDFNANGEALLLISLGEAGKIKSRSAEVSLSFNNEEQTFVQTKDKSFYDEYIDYQSNIGGEISKAYLKIVDNSSGAATTELIDVNTLYTNSESAITEYTETGTYKKTIIKISEILDSKNFQNGKNISVFVAPLHKNGDKLIQAKWSTEIIYQKLFGVESLRVDENAENIIWNLTNQNDQVYTKSTHFRVEASIVKGGQAFVNIERSEDKEVYNASYSLFNGGRADIGIYVLSSEPGYLHSSSALIDARRNSEINKNLFKINGDIRLTWGGLTEGEKSALSSGNPTTKENMKNNVIAQKDFTKILELLNYSVDIETVTRAILSNRLTKPFNFTISSFRDEEVSFVFQNRNGGREASEKIKAYMLLEAPTSEIKQAFNKVYTEFSSNSNKYSDLAISTQVMSNFNVALNSNNFIGYANDQNLFDEISDEISQGEYGLYIRQDGDASRKILRSDDAFIQNVVVEQQPATELEIVNYTNVTAANGATILRTFNLNFTPLDASVSGRAKNDISYHLVLSQNNNLIVFEIYYQSGWKLNVLNSRVTQINLTEQNGKITIPLNSVQTTGLDKLVTFNYNYDYSVALYALGGNESGKAILNGKHDKKTIQYYSQRISSINRGQITLERGYNNYLITEAQASSSFNITQFGQNTLASLNGGGYKFVGFIQRGYLGINNQSAYIDSTVIGFNDVYKLYQPNVSTKNGLIEIADNTLNSLDSKQRNYQISNNNSGNKNILLSSDENGNLEYAAGKTVKNANGSVIDREFEEYKATESDATSYDIFSAGSTVSPSSLATKNDSTIISGVDVRIYDYEGLILKSNDVILNAAMLKQNDSMVNINEEDGNFVWSAVENPYDYDNKTYSIVYTIIIEVYYKDGETFNLDEQIYLYTTATSLNSEQIPSYDDGRDRFYRLIVRANLLEVDSLGSIKTIEGRSYSAENLDLKYENDVYALRSEEIANQTTPVKKMTSVTSSRVINPTSVDRGQIYWTYTDSALKNFVMLYRSESGVTGVVKGSSNNDSYNTYYFVADYTQKFEKNRRYTYSIKVLGKNNEIPSKITTIKTAYNSEQEAQFYTLPDLTDEHLKLEPNITQSSSSAIKIDFNDYKNTLENLGEYGADYISIHVKYQINGQAEQTRTLSLPDLSFTIQNTLDYIRTLKLSVTPMPSVAYSSSNPVRILRAATKEFNLTSTSFGGEDRVVWDELSQGFSWTYKKQSYNAFKSDTMLYSRVKAEEDDSYTLQPSRQAELSDAGGVSFDGDQLEKFEFELDGEQKVFGKTVSGEEELYFLIENFYKAYNEDPANVLFDVEIDSNEKGDVGNYKITRFYQNLTSRYIPILSSGTVTGIRVRVKESVNSIPSSPIFLENQSLDFNLFEGGSGTEEDPYLIKTATQFNNIKYRQSLDDSMKNYIQRSTLSIGNTSYSPTVQTVSQDNLYFKQTDNISVESEGMLFGEFSGVYDGEFEGENKALSVTFTGSSVNPLEVNFNKNIQVDRAAAIFANNKGIIKNLKLSVNSKFSLNSSTLITGLALINEGQIENVELTDLSYNSFNVEAGTTVLVSGLVGINRGKVISCTKNESGVEMDVTVSANSRFSYGLFAVENVARAEINFTANSSDITIRYTAVNQAKTFDIDLAGITVANKGSVSSVSSEEGGKLTVSGAGGTVKSKPQYCY